MPNFKKIGSTIEKLASLANYAVISGKQLNKKAYFTIGLCNESISIKSKYSNLDLNNTVVSPNDNDEAQYKVRIDIRKLNQVFNALNSIKPRTISASISHENSVCFQFSHEYTNFTIILPNHDV